VETSSTDTFAERLSPRKRATFTIAMLLVPVLFPLLVAEIYMRVKQDPVDLWALTGRDTGPSAMAAWANIDAFSAYRGTPGAYKGDKTINSHGFISTPELPVTKPADTIRVVFLGGSSTAGTGGTGKNLADEDTWPWQVYLRLQEHFTDRKIEFINGALGGYTSFESYGRLWSRLRFFSPDIIVIYHGWNDMIYFSDANKAADWRTLPDGSWTLEETAEPVEVYKPLAIDYLIRPFQSLTYLRLFVTGPEDGTSGTSAALPNDFDHQALEVWRTNLRLFRQTSDVLDAELFVAKQATLVVDGLSPEEQARCRYEHHGFNHQAHVQAFNEIYRVIDEEIESDHIINTNVISGRPEYFYDHVHPTELGATEIATIVADALTDYLETQ